LFYSNDNGSTWSYAPTSGGESAPAGYDRAVTILSGALTALPSLNAGREIFHVASGTYSRLVPQTPEKIAGQIAGQTAFEGGEF